MTYPFLADRTAECRSTASSCLDAKITIQLKYYRPKQATLDSGEYKEYWILPNPCECGFDLEAGVDGRELGCT